MSKFTGYDPPYDDGYLNRAENVLNALAELPKHWREKVVEKLPATVKWYDEHRHLEHVDRKLPDSWTP